MTEEPPTPEQRTFKRIDDFVTGYANNVQFEPSAWDLKMVFGELSQIPGNVSIEQHTSITVSWPEAKMMSYYLQVQILIHEFLNGRIQVPKNAWPLPYAPKAVEAEDAEAVQAIQVMVNKMRE